MYQRKFLIILERDIPLRKTRDRWDIETNYGYGWETETSEYTYKEAKEMLACYRENSYGRFLVRLTKHREPIKESEV